eukprot:13970696-Ditylum_brightwellii.AAC.1
MGQGDISSKISKPKGGGLLDIDIIRLNTPVPGLVMERNSRQKAGNMAIFEVLVTLNKILMTTREKGINYPVLTKRLSGMEWQGYSRNMEVQSILKTDNVQIKVGKA